jgi:hypothetical protein
MIKNNKCNRNFEIKNPASLDCNCDCISNLCCGSYFGNEKIPNTEFCIIRCKVHGNVLIESNNNFGEHII